MTEIGLIGGSGVYNIPGLELYDEKRIPTPFGDPSDAFRLGRLSDVDIAFLPRHGLHHTIQPQLINYRANIAGFRELGVKRLLSVGASGGISAQMEPGRIVLPDQMLDKTSGRQTTFFDADEVVHIDFTEPFCPDLRRYILSAAGAAGIPILESGTYVCVNGPRLETAAEIRMFAQSGADIIGMTAMPEAALAREAGICYAGISVIANRAAGLSANRLTTDEVKAEMRLAEVKLQAILLRFFAAPMSAPECSCRTSLQQARM
jgi:5'-methylthioadenosine phosphorylase